MSPWSESAGDEWSGRLADVGAAMLALAVREHGFADHLDVRPGGEGVASDRPTVVAHRRGRRRHKPVDVVACDPVLGLQLAISLKGAARQGLHRLSYDKHLRRQICDLESEAWQLHSSRAQALVVGVYFLPLASVEQRRSEVSMSGFADAVKKLRAITGRPDRNSHEHLQQIDMGFVALYGTGDIEPFSQRAGASRFTDRAQFPRGVVRYFDVTGAPPKQGRPRVETTLSLEGMVDRIASRFTGQPDDADEAWAEPEPE